MATPGWMSAERRCDWQPLARMAYFSLLVEGFWFVYLASVAPNCALDAVHHTLNDMQRRRKHHSARAE